VKRRDALRMTVEQTGRFAQDDKWKVTQVSVRRTGGKMGQPRFAARLKSCPPLKPRAAEKWFEVPQGLKP
jgi:hypothetical protein